ncbi:MAG: hypothetical protein RIR51_1702 [Bacteroidota bacterium]|jgi:DtxR family Mn-dependent transcriptional regulator
MIQTSSAEENYLKVIYRLSEINEGGISTNSVAEMMQTKAASVTDMLKKLSSKGWIDYQKYQGVTLTPSGEKIALNTIRKHRLWETFLVNKLNFQWDEVHDIAEQLEHIDSSILINKLDEFLDFPKTDPHGDPIPNSAGDMHNRINTLLLEIQLNQECTLLGVAIDNSIFLKMLTKMGLSLGAKIKILEINNFDFSRKVLINNKKEVFVSSEIAKNIYVKKS